jgi:hypothetical protein
MAGVGTKRNQFHEQVDQGTPTNHTILSSSTELPTWEEERNVKGGNLTHSMVNSSNTLQSYRIKILLDQCTIITTAILSLTASVV